MLISFELNKEMLSLDVPDGMTLLDLLRDVLGVHSVKRGCENAECGACTVLVDGVAVNACIFLAVRADGKKVTTLEGVGTMDNMHTIQKQFVQHGAVQCGFCGSGMILSALSLLKENPSPSIEEIREGIAGNLCRCSGYVKIIEAIDAAAKEMREHHEAV